jgi:2-polyprenylphenol 6-hydroxylase
MQIQVDVCVVGNGVVGLGMALGLLQLGMRVAIVGKEVPLPPQDKDAAMVYAVNHANEQWLLSLGVWGEISPQHKTPYDGMEVWDASTAATLEFHAQAVRQPHLGHMVCVAALRYALWEQLQKHDLLVVCCPEVATALITHPERTILSTDHSTIEAQLLVAADGRQSWVAKQCAQPAVEWSCQQTALVAVVDSELAHGQVARQAFCATGPLALLPIDQHHRHAMVWSVDNACVPSMQINDADSMGQQVQLAVGSCLGGMTLQQPILQHPLSVRHLKSYWQASVVFVGDAAHAIHPLAGQGANLGMADAQVLCAILSRAWSQAAPLADCRLLQRYERTRRAANWRMLLACDGLQRLFSWTSMPVQQLRYWGIHAMARSQIVRQKMIQYALGV